MALGITQKEYDALGKGDHLIVACESWADFGGKTNKFEIHEGKVVFSDNRAWSLSNDNVQWNLLVNSGGTRITILKHTPKPKPEWHNAKVICETLSFGQKNYFVRNKQGKFVSSSGITCDVEDFVNTNVSIVVKGE